MNESHMTDRTTLVAARDGEQSWFDRNLITIKARAAETLGAYTLITSEAPVGSSPPLHVHLDSDEGIWIISGTLRIVCGERDYVLHAGDFTLLPRGVPHTFLVIEHTLMLGIMSPGGEEGFFIEGGLPVAGDTPPPVDIAKMAAAGDRYRVQVVGPPLTPVE